MFKMLEFLFVTASLGLLAGGIDFATVEATRTLPAIYWNASNPIFSGKDSYVTAVRMGDKLDIICPMRGRKQPDGLFYFNLYQVSEESFRNCNTVEEKRLLTCDSPYKEKKYTFLFQAITPSPWGLTFKEGEPYYFISTSDGTRSGFNIQKGGACTEMNMKLKIVVEKSGETDFDYGNTNGNNGNDDSNNAKDRYSTFTQRSVRTKTPTINQINSNSYNSDNEGGYHPGDGSDKSTGGSNTELVNSNGLVIGVVLGACAVLFIVLLSFLGYKVYRRRRHVKKYQSSTITSTRGPTPQTQVTLLPIGHQTHIHHPHHHHHHSVSSNHRLDMQDMRPPPPYNESMLDHAGSTMEV